MTPPIVRRPETGADAAFRFALFLGARHPLEQLPGIDPALAEQLLRHQFAGQGASYRATYPAARHEIIEVAGEPVGRLVLDTGAEAWTVVDLALLAAWRGRGLGTRLLGEVIAAAQAAGLPVRLSVMAHNVAAARLYRRLGFVVVEATSAEVAMELPPPPAIDAGSTGGPPLAARPGAPCSRASAARSRRCGRCGSGRARPS